MEEDELVWIRRCARGEAQACAELVARYGRMVGSIILRTLGRREDVEDLAQEVFLRVFRYLPEFEGRAKLSTWICTVAQRVAVDELRRRQRAVVTAPAEMAAEVPADDDVAHDVEQDERDALLHAALAGLPEKYRLPLVYASIEEIDYDTIAHMLGLPVGTVKTYIFRGKQQLRERLVALAPGRTSP
ncbi:MAG: sigma-70 family RNA polymerase sigma factor [Pseudomonadota bacterium]